MICPVCGKEIPDGMTVCPICGAALTAQPSTPPTVPPQPAAQAAPTAPTAPNAFPQYGTPQNAVPQYAAAPQTPSVMPTNVRQFIKSMSHIYDYKKIGTWIFGCAVLLYISAATTLVIGLIGESYGIILDVVIMVGLGLWIQFGYSRVAAILALIYTVFSMIITTISAGRLSGYVVVIASIFAVIYTFKANAEFKKFKQQSASEVPPQQFPPQ